MIRKIAKNTTNPSNKSPKKELKDEETLSIADNITRKYPKFQVVKMCEEERSGLESLQESYIDYRLFFPDQEETQLLTSQSVGSIKESSPVESISSSLGSLSKEKFPGLNLNKRVAR